MGFPDIKTLNPKALFGVMGLSLASGVERLNHRDPKGGWGEGGGLGDFTSLTGPYSVRV